MKKRRLGGPPDQLPESAPLEFKMVHEVIRRIFSQMADQGYTLNEFAEITGISDSTLQNWRSPKYLRKGGSGPQMLHIAKALSALNLELDVVDTLEAANAKKIKVRRIPLEAQTGFEAMERQRLRRKQSQAEWDADRDELEAKWKRMGLDRPEE